MKKKGIDISEWQKNVDYQQMKRSGIEFLIVRSSYRNTTDHGFFDHVRGARSAGIPIFGTYHFSYALNVNQVIQEAKFAVKMLQEAGLGPDTIVFYDFEYDSVTKAKSKGVVLGPVQCNLHTKVFCETVEQLGYRAGIYLNQDFYKNWYDHTLLQKYVVWFAHYTAGDPLIPCTVHQFSNKGSVSGIIGNVDMDWILTIDRKEEEMDERQKILDIARSFLGCKESDGSHRKIIDLYNSHSPLARGYKVKYTDLWCSTFVSACAIKAGLTDIIPTECGCEQQIRLFDKLNEWVENDNYIPSPADIIFYDWQDSGSGDDKGWSDHVGIVESCDGRTITVIEGNNNDMVRRRTIGVGSRYIRGFGVPKYRSTTEDSVPVPTHAPALKSVDDVAREVIKGLWGNGKNRKDRLTSAGYNYDDVQRRVNQILKGY